MMTTKDCAPSTASQATAGEALSPSAAWASGIGWSGSKADRTGSAASSRASTRARAISDGGGGRIGFGTAAAAAAVVVPAP